MPYFQIVLFLVAIAITVSAIAPKLKLPYPALLMVAGVGVGFIPGFSYVPIEPEWVYFIFLPPLLYDAAINISFPGFKKNLGTISMLAVTMVLITMIVIAVIARYFIPGIGWPTAFVLGAILSPPDAVAATATLQGLNLPGRTKVILEGESLVNDATALTAYRIALKVAMGGLFVWWDAGFEFLMTMAGGGLVGWGMAALFLLILRKVPFTSTATVALNILFPFVAYQLAELFSVSGVLSVVVMGIMISRQIHCKHIFTVETIVESRSFWAVAVYLLNGFIFILIGMEFPQVMRDIPQAAFLPLILSSLAIFTAALFIRILVIFERKFRKDKIRKKHSRTFIRHFFSGKKEIRQMRTLDWKNSLVIGWSGMRGIVSVATAIALPVTLTDGAAFPQRNILIFVTVVVVMLMLLIQGLGLPLLIRWLKIGGDLKKMEM